MSAVAKSLENLKPWKPGQSGNAGGRPKLPPELRMITQFTRQEISALIAKFGRMTDEELNAVIRDSKTPIVEIALCNMWKDAKSSDKAMQAFNFLLDRSVGKPAEIEPNENEEEKITVTKDNLKDLYAIARDG